MSYIRTKKRENPFVQLDKEFINDESLSWSARGVLAYILSKPNTWTIRQKDLINRSTDGRTKVERAMAELMAAGYLDWFQEKNEDGTFGEWVYEVYERPEYNPNKEECIRKGIAKLAGKKKTSKKAKNLETPNAENQHSVPNVENPHSENPHSENPHYSNNDLSNNEFSNKEEEDEEYNTIVLLVNENITPVNTIIKRSIKEWMDKLPYDVILSEVHNCIKRSARSWIYVENTLSDDFHNGVDTIEKVEAKLKNHRSKKKVSSPQNAPGMRKPIRKEMVPAWLGGSESVELSKNNSDDENYDIEEERRKLEEELKQFRK
ncbi:DnaD domain protein [Rossellomorea marisflavi]|uniref:DnaD domain protein n=1 Tax=Rossellomorea marisflavi TaxID=189381 RepID=UPI003D2F4C1F